MPFHPKPVWCISVWCVALSACSVGQGEGWVRSEDLRAPDCRSGPFDLSPDFFAANPYRARSLLIRVQRGDDIEELSDGLTVVVPDLNQVRSRLGQDLEVGLPPGVANPGTPPGTQPPAKVSLALYLHRSCHDENVTLYAVSGKIRFSALFSGDPNEESGAERLSEARFSADFGDPRVPAPELNAALSQAEGYFKFYFQRGQPAQPFP